MGKPRVREPDGQVVFDRLRPQLPVKETQDQRRSAPWEVKLAAQMKAATDASNGWLTPHVIFCMPWH
jgi:hypothetical protein